MMDGLIGRNKWLGEKEEKKKKSICLLIINSGQDGVKQLAVVFLESF